MAMTAARVIPPQRMKIKFAKIFTVWLPVFNAIKFKIVRYINPTTKNERINLWLNSFSPVQRQLSCNELQVNNR